MILVHSKSHSSSQTWFSAGNVKKKNHVRAVTHVDSRSHWFKWQREGDSRPQQVVRERGTSGREWITFALSLTYDSHRWGRGSRSHTVLKVALCQSLTHTGQRSGFTFSNRTAKTSAVLLTSMWHHVMWFYCAQRTLSLCNNFSTRPRAYDRITPVLLYSTTSLPFVWYCLIRK